MTDDRIQLKYCPRVGHGGNQEENMKYPVKVCKYRIYNKAWGLFECRPHPALHRYCKANDIDYSLEDKFVCTKNRIPYRTKTEIRTFRIWHERDFTIELEKARKIAEHAVKYRSDSSKDVSHIGLNSVVANAILRKYRRLDKIEGDVPLIVPRLIIRVERYLKFIWMASLQLRLYYDGVIDVDFYRVEKVIIDKEWATVIVLVKAGD